MEEKLHSGVERITIGDTGIAEAEADQELKQASGGDKYPILPCPGEISYRCFTGCLNAL